MWIVPKNFSGTYPSVQGIQDLGLDSSEFCQLCERSLMSKSKPTLFKTWLTKWNKDSYLQHLCTQTLKPSHSQTFVDAWTSYLAAFPASPLAKPGQEDQQKTHGISSHTLPMESTPVQQDMFSSKTSKELSPPKPLTGKVFSDMSSENWKDCVTRRRGEYSVRQKQAQAIRESEYLSLLQEMESRSITCSPDTQSQNPPSGQPDLTNNNLNGKSQESSNWPTPTVNCVEGGEQSDRVERSASGGYVLRKKNKPNITYGAKLSDAILFEERQKQENWPTPTTQEIEHKNMVLTKTGRRLTKDGSNSHSLNLTDKVNQENWATPNTMDHLPSRSVEAQREMALGQRKGRSKPANLREQVDPEQVAVYQEAKNWPTPTASEALKKGAQPQYGQICLSNHPIIVGPVTREKKVKSGNEKKWATPTTRDHKGSYSPKALVRKDGKSRMNLLPQQAQYDETNISKVGKLNPSWVEQLMGLPVQWSMLPEPTSVHRVSRLMLLGNGVVPQQAEVAFRTLLAQADQDHQS